MARVLHLIDDTGLGGVTRVLADQLPLLGDGHSHEIRQVIARRRLPGAMGADIVVVHFTLSWAKLPYLIALRARLGRARLVLVEHSYTGAYEQHCVANRFRFRTMLRTAYRLADRVVAVSHGQAAWIRAASLIAPARLVTIPQACDTSALTAVSAIARSGAQSGPLRLGAYGRYAPQKGFDTLIAAMRLLPPGVATLDLAGYGSDEGALRDAASGLPNVRICGKINGPLAFLVNIDAVVVPSRWEAFGLVAAEARAAGRPVLAAAVDGLVEQIEPAWGAVYAGDSPAVLAAAIQAFAARDHAAMSDAARQSVGAALATTVNLWARLLRSLGSVAETPATGRLLAAPPVAEHSS